MHTTNARDTFLTVAPDTRATRGTAPPERDPPSVAWRCYAALAAAPYRYTSDDVLFGAWADAQGLAEADRPAARAAFFFKGQPCFRASPLTKRYGWGVHHDAAGRIALVGLETPAYARLAAGEGPDGAPVTVRPAMRAGR